MTSFESKISKFWMYENSVQNPGWQLQSLPRLHKKLIKKEINDLREDFCGSGLLSAEWVRRSAQNTAVGLDLDPEAIEYAERVHLDGLKPVQKRRLKYLNQNVLKPTSRKFDSIFANNYSFFDFHERLDLLKYFKSAYVSLKSQGTLFLETAGGSGFLKPANDRFSKKLNHPKFGRIQLDWVWQQQDYDPITSINDYSLHYRVVRKKLKLDRDFNQWKNDVFRYNWRVWSIREIRELLLYAGFQSTVVFWPVDLDSEKFEIRDWAENYESWVAYVVGVKI